MDENHWVEGRTGKTLTDALYANDFLVAPAEQTTEPIDLLGD
jgi:hypothetical protein